MDQIAEATFTDRHKDHPRYQEIINRIDTLNHLVSERFDAFNAFDLVHINRISALLDRYIFTADEDCEPLIDDEITWITRDRDPIAQGWTFVDGSYDDVPF